MTVGLRRAKFQQLLQCFCYNTVSTFSGRMNTAKMHYFASELAVVVQACASEVIVLLVSLALCHTVHIHDSNSPGSAASTPSQQFEYHSASPDEKALVEACSR